MTIHYATDYKSGKVLVSVDNRTATKVSVWVDGESKPRQRFAGESAYDDAMNFMLDLPESQDDFGSNLGFQFATGTGVYSGSFDNEDY